MGQLHHLPIPVQLFIPVKHRPRFINTVLDHLIRILPQFFDKCSGSTDIQAIIGRHHNKLWTFLPCCYNGFPGLNAILFCRRTFGEHNPVPFFLIPADNTRDQAQILFLPKYIHPVCSAPGEECAVCVYMKNTGSHIYRNWNILHF